MGEEITHHSPPTYPVTDLSNQSTSEKKKGFSFLPVSKYYDTWLLTNMNLQGAHPVFPYYCEGY